MRATITMTKISTTRNATETMTDTTSNERIRTEVLEDTTISEITNKITQMYNNYTGDITAIIKR